MRTLFLLIPLALIGCNKPDPIEACVEAHKRQICVELELYDGACKDNKELVEELIAKFEPDWRLKCMKAAAGKAD